MQGPYVHHVRVIVPLVFGGSRGVNARSHNAKFNCHPAGRGDARRRPDGVGARHATERARKRSKRGGRLSRARSGVTARRSDGPPTARRRGRPGDPRATATPLSPKPPPARACSYAMLGDPCRNWMQRDASKLPGPTGYGGRPRDHPSLRPAECSRAARIHGGCVGGRPRETSPVRCEREPRLGREQAKPVKVRAQEARGSSTRGRRAAGSSSYVFEHYRWQINMPFIAKGSVRRCGQVRPALGA